MLGEFISPVANHLWQSTLFVAVAGVLTLALRKNQARVRYWIWVTASAKFLFPFSLLMSLGGHFNWSRTRTIPVESSVSAFVIEQVAQPFASNPLPAVPPRTATTPSAVQAVPLALAAIWFCGCAVLLFRWSRNWQQIRSAVRKGTLLTHGREFEALCRIQRTGESNGPLAIVSSDAAIEPSVFGMFHSILLWPTGITSRLSDEELETVLLHELSHMRCRDNLAGALHMIVEAVYWYHPLVWWLGARILHERERACDADVLRSGYASHVYAEGILKVCEFCIASPLVCAAGVSGSDLKKRIEEIMKSRMASNLGFGRILLLAVAAIAALTGPIMIGITHAKAGTFLPERPALQPSPVVAPVIPAEAPPLKTAKAPPQPETPRIASPQNPVQAGNTLEVVTIRPSVPDPNAPAGARGGLVSPNNNANAGQRSGGSLGIGPGGCKGGPPSFDGKEMVLNNNSLYTLITWAYGLNCLQVNAIDLLQGGQDWVRTDQWVIQTIIPAGAAVQISNRPPSDPPVKDPNLQTMLQKFLADRFKLVLHQETRDIPAYNLVVAKGGPKLRADAPFKGSDIPTPVGAVDFRMGPKATMSAVANFLMLMLHRPITDRTGITEGFPIAVFFAKLNENGSDDSSFPSLPVALEEQLGLVLQDTHSSVNVLIIDHAELPVQN